MAWKGKDRAGGRTCPGQTGPQHLTGENRARAGPMEFSVSGKDRPGEAAGDVGIVCV